MSSIRSVARIAIFSSLIAALGIVPPIGGVVPITAQTLGVMLAGVVLGGWHGAAAVLVLETLVAMGLPLLSGGHGGLAVFVGPTVGYLIGWILGALAIGLIVHHGDRPLRWWRVAVACLFGGILVVYAVGIPGLSWITGLSLSESAISSLVFIPGDVFKVVIATILSMALWRAYPAAFQMRSRLLKRDTGASTDDAGLTPGRRLT